MKRGTRALSVALWVLAGWGGPRGTALAGGATAGGNAEGQAARKDVRLARPGHRAPIHFNILHHQEDVPHDGRLGQPIPAENVGRAAMLLPLEDRIPYVVPIPAGETPILTNPAEFLNGMCNLFLQLRRGRSDGVIFILPSYVIPLSNLPSGIGLEPGQPHTQTRLDWYNGLQLWTAEPLRLTARGVGRLPQK